MKIKFTNILVVVLLCSSQLYAQKLKILFDASKAETAGNADWVVDADVFNIGYSSGPAIIGTGNEANAQITPTLSQKNITASTPETYWKGGLSNWGIDCAKKGYVVKTLPYNGRITYGDGTNKNDLSNFGLFIVCEPNIVFSAAEKTAIINYVKNGGSLFMISDHTASDRNNDGWDSPKIWNDLITNNSVQNNPFGISFDLTDFSETSTNIANLPGDSILYGPAGNVTQVKWSAGTSITISKTANPTVKGIVYRTGSSTTGTTNIMFAYCTYGKGKVAAISDSSPCDDGTGDTNDALYNGYTLDASGNHQRLLMNATIWLMKKPVVQPFNFAQTNITTVSKELQVFPNPVTKNMLVNFPAAEKNSVLKLCNASGEILLSQKIAKGQTQQNIDAAILSAGAYWLILEVGGMRKSIKLVMKQ